MRYLIAIDVGVRNLGFCVFDIQTEKVVDWRNVALCTTHNYVPGDNVGLVMHFVRENAQWFSQCAKLIIEKQIRCNMRIIEAVFHTLFFDKCVVVHAKNVKMHFNTSMKNYKDNKRRAVEFVTANLPAFAPEWQLSFEDNKKKDDLADALLLIQYFRNTFILN